MHIFRIFAVSVLIPLITVGLCATGESNVKVKGTTGGVRASIKRLDNGSSNSTVQFPSVPKENSTATDVVLEPRRNLDSLPIHPHPLKLEIKTIKNSTRRDDFNPLFFGEGRSSGGLDKLEALSWLLSFVWKAVTSYAIVAVINLLIAPLLSKFGWKGPSWSTSITLGKNSRKEEGLGKDGHGQGYGQAYPSQYGHAGIGGTPGPGHAIGGIAPAGWLSYDQYALALPYVDKYSQKAAKKSQRLSKKAAKYAAKAHKYAAKAQALRLQVRPATYGQLPGLGPGAAAYGAHGGYGWGTG